MIIDVKKGDILRAGEKHICFAVNTEGINDSGFAGVIAEKYWPELSRIGQCELGSSLTKEVNGVSYHALVCHSLNDGWKNTTETVKQCFDSIPTNEELATIAIGGGLIGMLSGANQSAIQSGMDASSKHITLYQF